MSIDEAIAKYKEITNKDAICPAHCNISCDKCVQESEQLVEWLEELKELKSTSFGYRKEDIELNRTAMYNKAIDDFAEAFDKWIKSDTKRTYYWTEFQVEFMKIAEQLKAGEENENYNKEES